MELIKEKARENLAKLIEKFKREQSADRLNEYNEEATKTVFIQPLLKDVLGWDVNNLDEVSPEENVSHGRVDYGLKVEGRVKIFVEAKPIKADLNKHIEQAVRYGYNRKDVPFVLLTDFEGIKLFDVTIKPNLRNLTKGLKVDLHWDQYLENFDKLWTFSKESVLNGTVDKLILIKPKEGLPVDKAILDDLERWREALAKDIFNNNSKLFHSDNPEKDANYLKEITQKILDRIIFMRSCEDRRLIHRHPLKELFEDRTEAVGINTMSFLEEEFRNYNIIFDSDLFSPQEWEKNLAIDFKVMKDIILETCNPYLFDVIPIEVLGNIYEQYLGYTIKVTEHQVKYEEKPDVRKAGGVYYTPEYIVDYIVKNTVGKLLQELSPAKIKKLRILDPACGSGSFLIRAYEEMLNWYLSQKKEKKVSVQEQEKLDLDDDTHKLRLTIQEKAKILREHIFGVDIDEQAVEVTKLSLMLKMLEGEYGIVAGRALLPMLDKNIKCGNSLISGDTLELKKYFGEEWYKVKPFNWDEQFRSIMVDEGGFDVVIGNPPYFNISLIDKSFFHYLEKKYSEIHTGYNDIMYYFIYKGIEILNKKGIFGFITSNYYLGNSYAKLLRKYLKKHISKILNFKNYLVFSEANIHTNIIMANKNPKLDEIYFFEKGDNNEVDAVNLENSFNLSVLARKNLLEDWVIANDRNLDLIKKVENKSLYLGNLAIIKKGATSGNRKIFTISEKIAEENKLEKDILKISINSKDIKRYCLNYSHKYLIYIDDSIKVEEYPNVLKYLLTNKKELSLRNEVKNGLYPWYRLERPREKYVFSSKEKIVVSYRSERNNFAFDNKQGFNDGGGSYAIILKDEKQMSLKYVLAILNSKLMNWYYGFIGKPKGKMREYFNEPMAKIPIYDISKFPEKKIYDNLVALVDAMLDLSKKIQSVKGSEKEQIQRQIDNTDKEIDEIVYKLYRITEEEKKIIEGDV